MSKQIENDVPKPIILETGDLITFNPLLDVISRLVARVNEQEVKIHELIDQVNGLVKADEFTTAIRVAQDGQSQLVKLFQEHAAHVTDVTNEISLLNSKHILTEKQLDGLGDRVSKAEECINNMQLDISEKASGSDMKAVTLMLANYAQKEELDTLSQRVDLMATQSQVTDMDVLLHKLEDKFNFYPQIADVESQFRDQMRKTHILLGDYCKRDDLEVAMTKVGSMIADMESQSSEKIGMVSTRVHDLSDQLNDLSVELAQKAFQIDLTHLKDTLTSDYSTRKDLDQFKEWITPQVQNNTSEIQVCHSRINQTETNIQRLDEIVLDKASKYDVVQVGMRLDELVTKQAFIHRIKQLEEQLKMLNLLIDDYARNLTAISNSNNSAHDHSTTAALTSVINELREQLQQKANKVEALDVYDQKSNKEETEWVLKSQLLLHRQLQYVAVTLVTLAQSLTSRPGEGKATKSNLRQMISNQAESVWRWITDGDPTSEPQLAIHPSTDNLLPPSTASAARRRNVSSPPRDPNASTSMHGSSSSQPFTDDNGQELIASPRMPAFPKPPTSSASRLDSDRKRMLVEEKKRSLVESRGLRPTSVAESPELVTPRRNKPDSGKTQDGILLPPLTVNNN